MCGGKAMREHEFDGERCIRCGTNKHDITVYNLGEDCIELGENRPVEKGPPWDTFPKDFFTWKLCLDEVDFLKRNDRYLQAVLDKRYKLIEELRADPNLKADEDTLKDLRVRASDAERRAMEYLAQGEIYLNNDRMKIEGLKRDLDDAIQHNKDSIEALEALQKDVDNLKNK